MTRARVFAAQVAGLLVPLQQILNPPAERGVAGAGNTQIFRPFLGGRLVQGVDEDIAFVHGRHVHSMCSRQDDCAVTLLCVADRKTLPQNANNLGGRVLALDFLS